MPDIAANPNGDDIFPSESITRPLKPYYNPTIFPLSNASAAYAASPNFQKKRKKDALGLRFKKKLLFSKSYTGARLLSSQSVGNLGLSGREHGSSVSPSTGRVSKFEIFSKSKTDAAKRSSSFSVHDNNDDIGFESNYLTTEPSPYLESTSCATKKFSRRKLASSGCDETSAAKKVRVKCKIRFIYFIFSKEF